MIKSKLISKATFYNKSVNKDIASFTEVASMNQTHSNVVLEIERGGVYDADALITTKKESITSCFNSRLHACCYIRQ